MAPGPNAGILLGALPDAVRLGIHKVLASRSFSGSARLSQFLRFTVDEALAGRGASLKEYTIATGVYERPPSFDPRMDPIVRVEARRLRDRLKEYYEGEGLGDPLRIDFPKGSYVPVFRLVPAEIPQLDPRQPWRRMRWPILILALASTAVAGYLAWRLLRTRNGPTARIMLVVLPFQNLTGDAEREYLSDGMTEEMSTFLGNLDPRRLGVIARTSAMKYKHTQKGVDEIGKELGVDYLLEGSVRRSGARLRVTAQLIQVRDQTHLWAQDYDREERDILALESEIAGAIASEVQIKVSPGQRPRPSPVRADAYEDYLRGRYFFNKGTEDGFRKGIEYFQEAIQKDPDYALAHDGLADAYAFAARYHSLPADQAFTKAREEASKALQISPDLAEGHSTLGEVLAEFWDWNGAGRELRRALELNPNYSLTHLRYGGYLAFTGHIPEAVAELKEAQRLDPLSPNVNAELANAYTALPNYDHAIQQSLRTLELEKDYLPAIARLAESYRKKGMQREAFEADRRIPALTGFSPERLAALDQAYAADGLSGYWRKQLEFALEDRPKQPFSSTFFIAWVYAILKNKEEALKWLAKAYQEHDFEIATIKLETDFDFIRSDPRFQDLLHRIGLSQ